MARIVFQHQHFLGLRPVSTTSVEKNILCLFYCFFFALASILTARFNRRSIKERKNALFHARSGNGPLLLDTGVGPGYCFLRMLSQVINVARHLSICRELLLPGAQRKFVTFAESNSKLCKNWKNFFVTLLESTLTFTAQPHHKKSCIHVTYACIGFI